MKKLILFLASICVFSLSYTMQIPKSNSADEQAYKIMITELLIQNPTMTISNIQGSLFKKLRDRSLILLLLERAESEELKEELRKKLKNS